MTYKENITAILECNFTGFKDEIIDSACNCILEQEPRWIPVSERLPEDSGDYLVCGHGKMWICEMVNLYGVRGWCNSAKNPTVEAWQPLPEPYKAESEEV